MPDDSDSDVEEVGAVGEDSPPVIDLSRGEEKSKWGGAHETMQKLLDSSLEKIRPSGSKTPPPAAGATPALPVPGRWQLSREGVIGQQSYEGRWQEVIDLISDLCADLPTQPCQGVFTPPSIAQFQDPQHLLPATHSEYSLSFIPQISHKPQTYI